MGSGGGRDGSCAFGGMYAYRTGRKESWGGEEEEMMREESKER